MTAEADRHVPVLTESIECDSDPADHSLRVNAMSLTRHIVSEIRPDDGEPPARTEVTTSRGDEATHPDRQILIAELQTEIASATFVLADKILRSAFAEMEASIFAQITGRLRRELPEMIDELLRERLGEPTDD